MGGCRGREHIVPELLRPHVSVACWGTQEVGYTELSEVLNRERSILLSKL